MAVSFPHGTLMANSFYMCFCAIHWPHCELDHVFHGAWPGQVALPLLRPTIAQHNRGFAASFALQSDEHLGALHLWLR